jgi:hypothetical protein
MKGLRLRKTARWLCAGLLLSGGLAASEAQVTQIRAIDIGAAITAGDVRATVVPSTGADSTKPFDGNAFTEMAILTSDSLVITLEFKKAVRVEKSKVFFWGSGTWRMEGADTVSEFATHTGAYALLVASNDFPSFRWDSVTFARHDIRCLRLSASAGSSGNGIYLGEWTLEGTVTFTSFVILPSPLRVIPGVSLQMRVKIQDDNGVVYPNFLTEPLNWITSDPSIATADPYGKITGKAIGLTTVTVKTDGNTVSGSAPVTVLEDFHGEKVPTMNIKVAVVYQDPMLVSTNRLHEEFGWRDPRLLVPALVKHFREATDSVVNFQIVKTVDATRLFTRLKGTYMSVTQYVNLLKETGWKTLKAASDSGQLAFDYRECVKYYGFDTLRNSGQIDEVWVFAAPYLAMYESQLLGPNAFWWNSPPIKDGTALTRLLSVMGLNFERGVDQAFHSFGHRVESAMIHAYEQAQGKPWDPTSADPTPWDLFTRINKDMPEQAHCGNVHFPPNGVSDYNYGNTTPVISYAENWYRYPYLFSQYSNVNVQTWYYTPGEPLAEGLDHLGYLRWWYGHLPRYIGVADGVLNNWWAYATDYEAAVQQANLLSSMEIRRESEYPMTYRLEQNYPNPFNPSTTVEFELASRSTVLLEVFNLLGQRIATPVHGELEAGVHRVNYDARGLSTGPYFYRLTTPSGVQTRKMLVLR